MSHPKTETLNWGGSVYASTTTKYNAFDRPVRVRQYAGPAPTQEPEGEGAGYQTTTMTYDGHGRLAASHLPEEVEADGQPASSAYLYNPDDTIAVVRDARGATTAFSYEGNKRHLVTGLTYGVAPGFTKTWADAQPVSFAYDAAGNRTSMTDGLGSISYTYDDLGRLTSERRSFAGLSSRPPYELSYEYTPAGALRKLTDPAGDSVSYGYDRAGQLSGVTGSNFANVTTYASGIKYRAWGAPKSVSYGDSGVATTAYDDRMRPSEYALNIPASTANLATSMRGRYDYNADGQLRQMTDLDDRSVNFFGEPPADRRFSRRFSYDQVGSVTGASGVNASGQDYYLPFSQGYAYDEFDNQTGRNGRYYYENFSYSGGGYVNNRRHGWNYDASGQVTHSVISGSSTGARDWVYDAAGRMTELVATDTANGATTTKTYLTAYDGDGLSGYEEAQGTASYIVRSTALRGEIVTRLDAAGAKAKTVIGVDGLLTAVQQAPVYSGEQKSVSWLHVDPAGLSEVTNRTGDKKSVYDPLGNYVSYQNPPIPSTGFSPFYSSSSASGLGTSFGFNGGSTNVVCLMDNMPASCDKVMHFVSTRVFGVEAPKVITVATYVDSPLPQLPGRGGPSMAFAAGGSGGNHLSTIIKGGIREWVTVYSGYDPITQYFGVISSSLFLVPGSGGRMPLSGAFAELYKLEHNYLLSLLDDSTSRCAEFLRKTLGFNASRVAKAVRAMRAYDADESTIKLGPAGLQPYRDPATGKSNPWAKVRVKDYFDYYRMLGAPRTAEWAGHSRSTMRDVYYSPLGEPLTAQSILHEALHMFTGDPDEGLAARLGITLPTRELENPLGGPPIKGIDTSGITNALKEGGCGR